MKKSWSLIGSAMAMVCFVCSSCGEKKTESTDGAEATAGPEAGDGSEGAGEKASGGVIHTEYALPPGAAEQRSGSIYTPDPESGEEAIENTRAASGEATAEATGAGIATTEVRDGAEAEDGGEIGSESEAGASDPRVRAKQRKELQLLIGLGKAFRVWALDEGGNYPPEVDHPEFAELLGKPEIFQFKNAETGAVARPWYFKGRNAESRANAILLASPWVYEGKRAVSYCDSSGEMIEEEAFQQKVAESEKEAGIGLLK